MFLGWVKSKVKKNVSVRTIFWIAIVNRQIACSSSSSFSWCCFVKHAKLHTQYMSILTAKAAH